jgi:hypothetical protein
VIPQWVPLPGALALAVLALLPGLVIVRAPWTAVPFLSLSFWAVTWWWLPAHLGRGRFVLGALGGFATLAALRILKPLKLRRPSACTCLVVASGLLPLVVASGFSVTPGAGMSRYALATLLCVWRDGPPASGEPLLPSAPFPSEAAGFGGVSADLALLSGLPAHRASSLVAAAALGLLHVAVFALLARLVARPVAALATVAGLAVLGWPDPAAALATACLLSGVALLVRGSGRSPAVAAGTFFAAAFEADAALAVALLPLVALAVAAIARAHAEQRRAHLQRFGLASGVALLLLAPYLLRAQASLRPQFGAFAPLGAAFVAALLAAFGSALARRRGIATRIAVVAALAAAAAATTARAWGRADHRMPLTADDMEAMSWLRSHSDVRDVVCSKAETPVAEWLPVFAERASVAAVGRPCAFIYVQAPRPAAPPSTDVLFHNAHVAILRAR